MHDARAWSSLLAVASLALAGCRGSHGDGPSHFCGNGRDLRDYFPLDNATTSVFASDARPGVQLVMAFDPQPRRLRALEAFVYDSVWSMTCGADAVDCDPTWSRYLQWRPEDWSGIHLIRWEESGLFLFMNDALIVPECGTDGQSEAYCTELSVTDGENIRGIYGLVDFDLDIDAACPAESLHLDCIRIRYVPLFDAWCPLPTEWWFARDVGLVGFTDAWGTWAVVDPAT